eukprot:31191-Pelagococcus_subviridis.AAC.26
MSSMSDFVFPPEPPEPSAAMLSYRFSAPAPDTNAAASSLYALTLSLGKLCDRAHSRFTPPAPFPPPPTPPAPSAAASAARKSAVTPLAPEGYQLPDLLRGHFFALERVLVSRDDLRGRLPRRVREVREVRVRERFFRGRSFVRVEREELIQNRERPGGGFREPLRQGNLRLDAHVGEKPPRFLVPHFRRDLRLRRSEQVGDDLELVHDVLPRKQRPTAQNLREDAPDAPYVDRGGVLREERPAQLRRAVPTRRDVVCPEDRRRAAVLKRRPREPEVADFQLAIRVG